MKNKKVFTVFLLLFVFVIVLTGYILLPVQDCSSNNYSKDSIQQGKNENVTTPVTTNIDSIKTKCGKCCCKKCCKKEGCNKTNEVPVGNNPNNLQDTNKNNIVPESDK